MITVLGASGFVGSRLVKKLRDEQIEFYAPQRDEILEGKNLGKVIYCIGLTADFRTRPFDTVEAHVCKLKAILQNQNMDSLTYLSSTRIYSAAANQANEDDSMIVNPSSMSDLYNLSKLMGESIALHSNRNVHVVRLSNVYGDDWNSENFLTTIIRDALRDKHILLRSSMDSEKDYISIQDVVDGLIDIALYGKQKIYNLANGKNISNGEIVARLAEVTGCTYEVILDAPRLSFPPINVQRMRDEFDFSPSSLVDDLQGLIERHPLNERHVNDLN